jgi:glycerol-3-phosphate acyltransferase PlsY
MLVILKFILGLVISYLLGCIPTAYVVSKLSSKIDIRNFGSGNVGATNVFRVLGKFPGVIVLIIDILKGIIVVTLIAKVLGLDAIKYRVIFGGTAVLGHIWTVFLKFKGGKGVATSLGVLLGLAIGVPGLPLVLIISVLTWTIVFILSGFVSLASMLAIFFTPIYMLIFNQEIEIVSLGILLCVIIISRHTPNIKRLLAGVEPRVKILDFIRKRFL